MRRAAEIHQIQEYGYVFVTLSCEQCNVLCVYVWLLSSSAMSTNMLFY